ncbi:MAG: flagellar biosynthesis protein FlhF [Capsulimonadaceae bacterium]|nr:flagellar biosynthesis protein FlhF [Capsulimonadaceae bacterium]
MKTFRGKSLEECFQQVKTDMGREAVILQSRTYQPIFGKFGKPRHEVVAALDIKIAEGGQSSSSPARSPAPSARPAITAAAAARPGERPVYGYSSGDDKGVRANGRQAILDRPVREPEPSAPAAPPPDVYDRRLDRLEQQISALTSNMSKLTEAALARKKKPDSSHKSGDAAIEIEPLVPHALIAKRLADAEVVAPVIRQLMEDLAPELSDQAAATEVRTRISQRLRLASPVEPITGKTRVVAFLGATGVGKTTTLTKIAARLSLLSNYSVGVITMDTHRIAAAKQLETYGEILRVPVKICYNRTEVLAAVEEYAAEKKHFVLIDTAGKSPNDALPLAEVGVTLKEIATISRVLCVPATLSSSNIDHMVGRFHSLLAPDALILTKLDEAADETYLGHLLNIQARFGIPLQYFTNGQRVPDDLSRPDCHVIADKILPQAAL